MPRLKKISSKVELFSVSIGLLIIILGFSGVQVLSNSDRSSSPDSVYTFSKKFEEHDSIYEIEVLKSQQLVVVNKDSVDLKTVNFKAELRTHLN